MTIIKEKVLHQCIIYVDILGEINNTQYLLPGKHSTISPQNKQQVKYLYSNMIYNNS